MAFASTVILVSGPRWNPRPYFSVLLLWPSSETWPNVGDWSTWLVIFKNSVRTPQKTHFLFITEESQLMLFRKIITAYSENRKEDTNGPCGESRMFMNMKAGGTDGNHCDFLFRKKWSLWNKSCFVMLVRMHAQRSHSLTVYLTTLYTAGTMANDKIENMWQIFSRGRF